MEPIKTRLSPELKARFQALADEQRTSDSELLRQLILDALEEPEEGSPTPILPSSGQSDLERITVRLPRFIMEGVKERGKRRGMAPSRWISALVQTNLMKQPVLTDTELLVLEESNRELAALGRNLNQIARALNVAFHETERVRLDLLGELKVAIENNRKRILALVRVSCGAWGEGD